MPMTRGETRYEPLITLLMPLPPCLIATAMPRRLLSPSAVRAMPCRVTPLLPCFSRHAAMASLMTMPPLALIRCAASCAVIDNVYAVFIAMMLPPDAAAAPRCPCCRCHCCR